MELKNSPNIQIYGSFCHFKDIETLISHSDLFIAFQRAVYMKDYGLSYEDAQECALMEYDIKLDIMANGGKIETLTTAYANKMNMVKDHLGQEFPSLGYLCKHWHIQPYTFTRRRNLGWSLKEAILGRKSIKFGKVKE